MKKTHNNRRNRTVHCLHHLTGLRRRHCRATSTCSTCHSSRIRVRDVSAARRRPPNDRRQNQATRRSWQTCSSIHLSASIRAIMSSRHLKVRLEVKSLALLGELLRVYFRSMCVCCLTKMTTTEGRGGDGRGEGSRTVYCPTFGSEAKKTKKRQRFSLRCSQNLMY